MIVLIDSWSWIEYFKGSLSGNKVKEFIENEQEVIISTINLSEVYGWLLRNQASQAQKLLQFMMNVSFVIPVSSSIALTAAKLKYDHKLGLADALILATAREHNGKVITGDDDFKQFKDVIYLGK